MAAYEIQDYNFLPCAICVGLRQAKGTRKVSINSSILRKVVCGSERLVIQIFHLMRFSSESVAV